MSGVWDQSSYDVREVKPTPLIENWTVIKEMDDQDIIDHLDDYNRAEIKVDEYKR